MSSSESRSARQLRPSRRVLTVIVLVAVVIVSTFIYAFYSLGADSASKVGFSLVQANRYYVTGTFPNRNYTFLLEILVVSSNAWLDVNLSPRFSVAGFYASLGNVSLPSVRLPAGGELVYNFRFSGNESRELDFGANDTGFNIRMTATATSGFYSGTVQTCDRPDWKWNTMTAFRDSGFTCPAVWPWDF